MIRALFARLTGAPSRGQALFDAAVAEARRPHWYLEGEVPDTVDGRFAALATVTALILVRLEQAGDEGREASVALSERFVEALDTEVREMGVGEPTLGKQVRRLVGSLAGRVERWRGPVSQGDGWSPEVRRSLYRDSEVRADALTHSESALRALWARLAASETAALAAGRIG